MAREEIIGTDGDDTLTVGDDDYTIYAGTGDDVITAGNGSNAIVTGSGNNVIVTGGGDNYIGAGIIPTPESIDSQYDYNKLQQGDVESRHYIEAGVSASSYTGEAPGNNDIYVASGTAYIKTRDGDHEIRTANGDDVVITGAGDSVIDTKGGDDTISYIGDGNHTIRAGAGDDLVSVSGFGPAASEGASTVHLGPGRDTVAVYEQDGLQVTIQDLNPQDNDRIILSSGSSEMPSPQALQELGVEGLLEQYGVSLSNHDHVIGDLTATPVTNEYGNVDIHVGFER